MNEVMDFEVMPTMNGPRETGYERVFTEDLGPSDGFQLPTSEQTTVLQHVRMDYVFPEAVGMEGITAEGLRLWAARKGYRSQIAPEVFAAIEEAERQVEQDRTRLSRRRPSRETDHDPLAPESRINLWAMQEMMMQNAQKAPSSSAKRAALKAWMVIHSRQSDEIRFKFHRGSTGIYNTVELDSDVPIFERVLWQAPDLQTFPQDTQLFPSTYERQRCEVTGTWGQVLDLETVLIANGGITLEEV